MKAATTGKPGSSRRRRAVDGLKARREKARLRKKKASAAPPTAATASPAPAPPPPPDTDDTNDGVGAVRKLAEAIVIADTDATRRQPHTAKKANRMPTKPAARVPPKCLRDAAAEDIARYPTLPASSVTFVCAILALAETGDLRGVLDLVQPNEWQTFAWTPQNTRTILTARVLAEQEQLDDDFYD